MHHKEEFRTLIKVLKKLKLKKKQLHLHEPFFDNIEKEYLNKCISSTFVSTAGTFISDFEKKILDYTKSKYAIAVNSGTSALHIALESVGSNSKCEVMVPAVTFVGTVNAILYTKATPHFIDCCENNPNIDVDKLKKYLKKNFYIKNKKCYNRQSNKILKAIVPVHVFGHSIDVDKLKKLAKDFHIYLIEDAAEAIGSFYNKKHLGTIGDIGILSFNGNKTITTGSGGMILTRSKKLYVKMKHISSTAKLTRRWSYTHDEIGYNYRMNNISAAIGCAQFEKLEKIIKSKRKLYSFYKKNFENFDSFELLSESKNTRSNYWLNAILLKNKNPIMRDKYLNDLHNEGIFVRPIWDLMSSLKFLKKYPKMDLTNSRSIQNRIINLPSSPFLIK